MSRRLSCILVVLGALAVCCVGVVGVALYSIEQERSAVKKTYGEQAAAMCDPAAGGTADRANLPEGTPLAALVLINDDSQRHAFHENLPDELRADTQEEMDVVMCVSTREREVERCPYTATGAEGEETEFTIIRIQKLGDIVLLNATTGNRIAEISFEGSSPALCPDNYTATTEEVKQNGADPTYNDFLIAVEPILRGQ